MVKFWACFSVFLLASLTQDWNFSLHTVGASETDPTLLKPDNHEAIIDEKEDSRPSKKSDTDGRSNDISYSYLNYRIANRTDGANRAGTVLPQIASSTNTFSKIADKSENGALNGIKQANAGNAILNSVQKNDANQNTQAGAGLQTHANQNSDTSVEKALAFYESILANAKKNEKDGRHIKSESLEEKEKSYADGFEGVSTNFCNSEECKRVAKYIKGSMNETADPCDDFYTFSCGGWKERNNIPESENEITAFTKLTKKIENATHVLLTEPPQPGESEALTKARKFFFSCMNTEKIEADGPKPALEFIEGIEGWSMCGKNGWDEKNWDVYKVLKDIQSKYYPAPPFFTVEVTNDHLNSTRHLIKVCISIRSFSGAVFLSFETHGLIVIVIPRKYCKESMFDK